MWSIVPRCSFAGPYSPIAVGAAGAITVEVGAVHQRTVFAASPGGISRTPLAILGRHMWALGYFRATVAAVDEATIKAYIESQRWGKDDESFKITAPTKP